MARTKHQIVQKVVAAAAGYEAGKRKGAKNSKLKQQAHQGRTPVGNPRSAQSGYTAVPASTATLSPGEGPPMSSTPIPARRGRNSRAGNPQGPVSSGRLQAISPRVGATNGVAARTASARRRRGRRGR